MQLGVNQSSADDVMFFHTSPRGRSILLLYVDDMIIIGDDFFLESVKTLLH